MKLIKFTTIFLIGIFVLGTVSACAPQVETASPEQVLTSVAETVAIQFTKTAIAKPSATPAPTLAPTTTSTPVTPTTAVPTANLTQPAASKTATSLPPSGGVDSGTWAYNNPVDESYIDRGAEFKVTVGLMNNGTTTWTKEYYIQFSDGDRMGAESKIMMPYEVPPTKIVEFSIDFTAPTEIGPVHTEWSIVNPNGVVIGIFWFDYIVD